MDALNLFYQKNWKVWRAYASIALHYENLLQPAALRNRPIWKTGPIESIES